ncbi:MAG: xanthine dehydrogenase [Acidobacteria bacterium]|nr:MAG: xanthine dehydrogenase [Acidobacteriota bacterium]
MVKLIDSFSHVRGESLFVDDFPLMQDTLYAAVVVSPAVGNILAIHEQNALHIPGVVGVLSAKSIPGYNQIGGIIPDEPLFATNEAHFAGQAIALVVARSRDAAYLGRNALKVEIEAREPVLCPREAYQKGQLLQPPRLMQMGDPEAAWDDCDFIVEGRVDSGSQEHLYLETQGCLAIPEEQGHLKIISSTQSPTGVQRMIARVLDLPMHQIEVQVLRLGGAFGGKEDQAAPWAVMAALAAQHYGKPVKLVLERHDDLAWTGKRHPYSTDYRLGFNGDLKIVALDVTYYQNGGASADLSPAILERTICHATGSYYIPHVKITAYSCRTNLPPFTAFRGFGGPQALLVIESAIMRAARKLGCRPHEIQKANLLKEGDLFPFSQRTEACTAEACWKFAEEKFHLHREEQNIKAFNRQNTLFKMGLAMMPICFGISFNKTSMNQAGALVHIYQDGSVGISSAAVEMGQGVNTKLVYIAATVLGISADRIRIEPTNTTRVANTSPTAASSAADLNGRAVEKACLLLLSRLLTHAAEVTGYAFKDLQLKKDCLVYARTKKLISWQELVSSAFNHRVDLSEHAYYATPEIYFDKEKNQGKPFAYHVYGSALVKARVDILRGTYRIESVKIVHDFGKSLNPEIDRGQVEGALAQGIGWLTTEEVRYSKDGLLLSNSLSNYKVPDLNSLPADIETHFLETKGNEKAVFKSKAIGEPPFLYGIGAYFALHDAVQAFRAHSGEHITAPLTPEAVFNHLHGRKK